MTISSMEEEKVFNKTQKIENLQLILIAVMKNYSEKANYTLARNDQTLILQIFLTDKRICHN